MGWRSIIQNYPQWLANILLNLVLVIDLQKPPRVSHRLNGITI